MKDPASFIAESLKANISAKTYRKCMDILREYHYHFSYKSPPHLISSPTYNMFSEKSQIVKLHKIQTFD
jgi:hypothetical protein